MKVSVWTLAAIATVTSVSAQAQEWYGGASGSGIYSSSDRLADDEVLDSSAIVVRGYAGVRWDPKGDTTRLQASSSYYGYFDRKDRWSNAAELEKQFRLSDVARVAFEGSGASNISTLEARSADQLAGAARLIYEPGDHRIALTGAIRRRYYDGSNARSWSPLLEVDYRYRLGRYNYLDLEARHESVDSNNQHFDYNRLGLGAYYTHPLGRDTRVRVGVANRWWRWDEQLTPAGRRQRDRVFVPQARLTHSLTKAVDLEADYRYFVRRSNNDALDRDGHRLAGTVRVAF